MSKREEQRRRLRRKTKRRKKKKKNQKAREKSRQTPYSPAIEKKTYYTRDKRDGGRAPCHLVYLNRYSKFLHQLTFTGFLKNCKREDLKKTN